MTRRVVVLTFPAMQTLDVAGPVEVFADANRLATPAGLEPPRYQVVITSLGGGLVPTSSGLALDTVAVAAVAEPIDTLVVAGGTGAPAAAADRGLVAELLRLAGAARRVTSVCSGAFLLAEAGLLDGRRATTHWNACAALAARYPAVTVDPDPIYVRDGDVWTSAGVTAGMDLALALVADDHGPALAREIARWLVLFIQRPGGQAQFSTHLQQPVAARDALRDLMAWLPAHLGKDLGVAALARRAGMSERTFARAFRAEVGATPAAYVERLRVHEAQRALEATDLTVAAIARRCGFGSAETLHRAFRRHAGTTPNLYRRHFQVA